MLSKCHQHNHQEILHLNQIKRKLDLHQHLKQTQDLLPDLVSKYHRVRLGNRPLLPRKFRNLKPHRCHSLRPKLSQELHQVLLTHLKHLNQVFNHLDKVQQNV